MTIKNADLVVISVAGVTAKKNVGSLDISMAIAMFVNVFQDIKLPTTMHAE